MAYLGQRIRRSNEGFINNLSWVSASLSEIRSRIIKTSKLEVDSSVF